MNKRYNLLLLLLGIVMHLFSQEYSMMPLPTHRQLPVANVHTIMQDSEGYMWYATREGGLCRDNGYHIDIFRSDRLHPDLIGTSNDIRSITEDKHHHIIFVSGQGVYVLDKQNYHMFLLDAKLKGKGAENVYTTSDGTIWISTDAFIYHYDEQLKCIGIFRSLWKGKEVRGVQFYEDSHACLWAIQWDGGLIKYNRNKKVFEEQPWIAGVQPVRIVEDKVNHCYWVSTWGKGIMKYCPERNLVEHQRMYDESVLSMQVLDMKMDSQLRCLWISTMKGLYGFRIVKGQLFPISLEGLVPQGTYMIDGLALDRSHNLWVSGFSPVTFIISPKQDGITRYGFADLTKDNRTIVWNAVREGEYLWVGQERLGVSVYNLHDKKTSFAAKNGDRDYMETDMSKFSKCIGRDGVWSFLNQRLFWLGFKNGQFQKEHLFDVSAKIKCLYDDGTGNLLIGTRNGIDVYHQQTHKFYPFLRGQGVISDIVRAKDGTVYFISSKNQLASKDRLGKVHTISKIGDFTSLTMDQEGNVWAADRQGDLVCYNPKTKIATLDAHGSNQNGDAIKDVAVDHAGHLWLVSDQFVKEYNPKNGAYRVIACQDKNINMDCFSSVSVDDDAVNVCGSWAVLHITPSLALNSTKSNARCHITSVMIDDKEHIIGMGERKVTIRPNDASVVFQLSTLNHLNAEKVTYAYRLKGMDEAWHVLPIGNNKVSFFKLAKGTYQLEVKATDEFGRWSDIVTTLTISRVPAWYESWIAYCIYFLLVVMAIVYVFRRNLAIQRHKQHEKMQEELTEMKFRFFTNVSHELRTPLTLIVTPVQSLLKKLSLWSEEMPGDERIDKMKQQVSLVNDNASRLLSLVNRLLDFRKLEMGQMKLELTSGDVFDFIRNVCEMFRPMSQDKGIGLGCAIPNRSLMMYFDANKLRHILSNLLSNAFKFTQEGGNIAVSVSVNDNAMLAIHVKDNGCGIAANDLQHIFDRYYQGTHQRSNITGTGIGLNMVQEFVQLHQGTLKVESKVGEGTAFTVLIPTTLKPVSVSELTENSMKQQEETSASPIMEIHSKPTLLVVDDNDEFRQFLVSELESTYQVMQAGNGEDALKIVLEQNIDLVVSDVMMPGMDGMSLCQHIKSDVKISHVMVILLTARAAEESKLEGLRAGADDYLSKPFNMEMLQLRIAHLLDLRSRRMQKFTQEEDVKVEEVALNEIDQKFLEDAMAAVEKNLDNDAYDVETFCSDLCMSRSTCYRKLLSLTGQKPTEFIRTIRLKHAIRMLKEKKYTVSEISDMCGFSSVSYFCRCFKSQYGVQPSNYKD